MSAARPHTQSRQPAGRTRRAAARRRGQRPHAGWPRGAAGLRIPRGARHAGARPQVRAAGRRQWRARGAVGAGAGGDGARPAVGDRGGAGAAPARARQHHRRPLLRCAVARRCRWRASPAPTARPPVPIYWRRRWRPPAVRPPTWAPSAPAGRARWSASALTTGDAVTVQRTLAQPRADGAAQRRDGSVLARHRPVARRRGALPHRRVHQSHARPSRLPRHHGELRRHQGAPVHARRARARASSTSTIRSAAQLALDPRGRGRLVVTSRGHQSHARAADGFVRAMHVELSPRGIELEFDSSWGCGRADQLRWSAISTSTTCSPSSRCCSTGSLTPEQAADALGARARRAGSHGNLRRQDARRSRWSTTRTRPTRCARRCARRAHIARPAGGGVRLRRRSRSGQAAADGRDRRRARRRHRAHRRQPAHRIAATPSSRASRRAFRPARPYRIEHDRGRAIRDAVLAAATARRGGDRGQGPRGLPDLRRRAPRTSATRRSWRAALAARVGGAA